MQRRLKQISKNKKLKQNHMTRILSQLDLKHVWHPFTQETEWQQDTQDSRFIIHRGRGVYLYDHSGKQYIDGISSLWTNVHGHNHPKLNAALTRQLKKIAHSTFLGWSHEPGIRLAKELLQIVPPHLQRIFYSDNGSTAVEVALKMAYQYHAQTALNQVKTKNSSRANNLKKVLPDFALPIRSEFLALKNSYHGDTIGSVSVGGISLFHQKFKPLLFKTHFAMSPHCLQCPHRKTSIEKIRFTDYKQEDTFKDKTVPKFGDDRSETGCRWQCLGDVERILKKRSQHIAAAIIEPVVQGASGMLLQPSGYLRGFEALCKKYKVLWIADEVATGFGRTGNFFACQKENVSPDLLCVAKGITGGYLPLAATLSTEKVFQAFRGNYDTFKTFFHGHTYTANPLACSVARENIRILSKQKFMSTVQQRIQDLTQELQVLLQHQNVGQIRQVGLMVGVEIFENTVELKSFPTHLRIGKKICDRAKNYGVFLRPLGDVIVLMPPLVINRAQIKKCVRAIRKSIRDVLG